VSAPSSPKKLAFWPLVGALYFMVSGGPFGLEELVQKLGFGGAIACLVATPIVWSLPTALMIGELGTALPLEGGYYAWVRRSLGPFWGFQEAWLSMVASVFDMAIYPTLFVSYIGRLWPEAHAYALPIELVFIGACVAWNLRGAKAVGDGSVVLSVVLLAPFAILSVVAFAQRSPDPAPVHPSGGDLLGGLLIAMWNYMGWDNASTIAAEVDRPERTYSRAVFVAVVLVALSYVVPVAAVAATGTDPSTWTTGAWVDVAETLAGRGLALAIAASGAVSALGMWSALLLSYSRVPSALAADGYLPKILARHSPKTGAPHASIVACAVLWTLSLGLSFERLVLLDVLFYGTSLLLEFVALAWLRRTEPALVRPYRIPGGTRVAWLVGLPPAALIVLAVVRNWDERMSIFGVEMGALVFGLVVMAGGPLVYAIGHRHRSS
jgi:amino acid transporter